MAIGFDYGTANCSVAELVNDEIRQIPLVGDSYYIPSTLCAPTAEVVSEYLFRCLDIEPGSEISESVLRRAIKLNREEGLEVRSDDIRFGQQALELYLEDPKDVYYVKSPKSFLGVTGLRDMQLAFFEDLVCAMMANIKTQAECSLQKEISQTVIGRPVNFLGRGGNDSNLQAEGILRRAARRAGFKDIEFQFEPLAAGLDYEASLEQNKNVLVVDIGGGTTDCSFVQMGPSWCGKQDRSGSLIAHSGQRIGGNDLDIFTAFKCFMQEFGMGSTSQSGLDIPTTQFWNPIAINDVQAQRKFYAHENLKQLRLLLKEAREPEKLARLVQLHQETLGYSVIREAEQTKIALADATAYNANLDLLSEVVSLSVTRQQMEEAIVNPTEKIKALVIEAIKQSSIKPDVIYMTGGSARSPILTGAVKSVLPDTPVISGNYFGSVTAGLARWANTIFR
ncbi:molecular chaperone [Vibrio coralliilyticus]|uniref:molecular chaperone n=1 Tax=Vibrio coralliilyticus TaxID=190893 RepID=UPI001560B9D2|nr:molecular chaperone [Vibrio coralliilyticus]NRF23717.1 molecular chaperone [Vibrio coralliilyticus]NRF77572.1 molecular chaperone [Vibrio coralliilyticus]